MDLPLTLRVSVRPGDEAASEESTRRPEGLAIGIETIDGVRPLRLSRGRRKWLCWPPGQLPGPAMRDIDVHEPSLEDVSSWAMRSLKRHELHRLRTDRHHRRQGVLRPPAQPLGARRRPVCLRCFALVIAYFGAAQQGAVGWRGIDVTIASLVSLVIYLVPLIALILGYDAIVAERERGSLDLLLSMPITRFEVLLGKYTGLAAGALGVATVAGFGAVGASSCPPASAWTPSST
jgi:hypothetical protein